MGHRDYLTSSEWRRLGRLMLAVFLTPFLFFLGMLLLADMGERSLGLLLFAAAFSLVYAAAFFVPAFIAFYKKGIRAYKTLLVGNFALFFGLVLLILFYIVFEAGMG